MLRLQYGSWQLRNNIFTSAWLWLFSLQYIMQLNNFSCTYLILLFNQWVSYCSFIDVPLYHKFIIQAVSEFPEGIIIKDVVITCDIFSNDMVFEECSEFRLQELNKGLAKFFTLLVKILVYLYIRSFWVFYCVIELRQCHKVQWGKVL